MTTSILSTAVMGLLAVLVFIAIIRSHRWYNYSADADDLATQREDNPGQSPTATPLSWLVGFVGLVALSVGGVFLFVTNPDAPAALLSGPVIAIGGLLVLVYLLAGTYYAAKGRGHPSSLAAAESATVFAVLILVAISSQLIG